MIVLWCWIWSKYWVFKPYCQNYLDIEWVGKSIVCPPLPDTYLATVTILAIVDLLTLEITIYIWVATCIIVLLGLRSFLDKSEADLGEKVHEERPVEVFAHLVENKPDTQSWTYTTCENIAAFICRSLFNHILTHQSPSFAALTKTLICSTFVDFLKFW